MKKILLTGLAVVLIALAVFLVVVALQPADYQVSRSATIAAPVDAVFAKVNDFRQWDHWSPWADLDPDAKYTYEGPEQQGEGAICRWSGNHEVGEGSMEIVESDPGKKIRLRLEFIKPMEGGADVTFDFEPEGEGTSVTWTMSGENNFIGKAMCLFMDIDEMVGSQYEEGLANLKALVEAG